jgi:hypothetical protein
MRKIKANLMATLILGDGKEMGYFADVSEENAASILRVNPEDAGTMALQNASNISCCSVAPTAKVNNIIIVKIEETVLLKYKCKGTAVPAQLQGPQKYTVFKIKTCEY